MTGSFIDRRRDKCVQHVVGGLLIRLVCTDAEDVGTVVPASDLGLADGTAERRADALEAVCRHRHSHTSTADQNAKIDIALCDGHGDVSSIVRIIASFRIKATAVTAILESGHKLGLEFESAVIGADGNLHLCGPFVNFRILYQKRP